MFIDSPGNFSNDLDNDHNTFQKDSIKKKELPLTIKHTGSYTLST